ncbi:DUF6153 family protein [Microbacterium sp. KSW2-29]|uniref:DUF6153 family protein n=1 Tax=Microbacterium phycohabitans TaxID=3075993 RepID=A0ABU3SMI8_9MICO|nr:DUF6153 family protein [Microbacterium sp. KSW2-29]MDU0345600.1 DUF6153 family protein [Microbacterium sp. KSW2-29]
MLAGTSVLRDAHARRPALVAVLAMVAAALIVGLLAMHVLNDRATMTGHHGTAAIDASAASDHVHPVDTSLATMSAQATDAADPVCEDCGGDHAMSEMGCILALVAAALLVFAATSVLRRLALRDLLTPEGTRRRARSAPGRPPSLISLCVCRT